MRRLARGLARGRRVPARAAALLLAVLVAGIVVAADAIAAGSDRSLDLTRAGLHTLSPPSVAAARRLGADLVVTGFFRAGEQQPRADAADLLDLYRQQSPHVRVRFVDPDRDPALALRLGATVTRSLVLQYGSRPPVVLQAADVTEAGVTGAIARLESGRSPTVCWATGDGERDLKDADQLGGYSAAANLLATSDYRVRTVAPGDLGTLAACDVLAVVQLRSPLSAEAAAAVRTYLDGGGSLLVALDPWLDPRVAASVNAVTRPYGATFDGGLVIEPDPAHAAAGDTTVPTVSAFGDSPVTRDLAGRYVFFPQATAVSGTGTGGSTSVALATTSGQAFEIPTQRTDLARRTGDRAGPLALMRSVELRHGAPTTRLVLAGTSALAENQAMPPAASGANADLLLGALDWLSGQAPQAVPAKPAAAVPLSPGAQGLRVNVVVAAVLLPLLVVAAGAIVRVRHRRPE